jgi:hypothetical protein
MDKILAKDIVEKWNIMKVQFPIYGVRQLPLRVKQSYINVRVPIPSTEYKFKEEKKEEVEDEENKIVKEVDKTNIHFYNTVSIDSTINGGEKESKIWGN